jgi:hypothetical protein
MSGPFVTLERVLDLNTTTITVNGSQGERFLTSLLAYRAPVPRALRWLAQGAQRSISVDPGDAENVARFVDELLASGWIDVDQPLLFSPRIGDEIRVTRDTLAEVTRQGRNAPLSWRLVEAGTRGKLIGWLGARAVIDLHDVERRVVVILAETKVTRARRR